MYSSYFISDELVQELLECDSVLDKMTESHDTSPQKVK